MHVNTLNYFSFTFFVFKNNNWNFLLFEKSKFEQLKLTCLSCWDFNDNFVTQIEKEQLYLTRNKNNLQTVVKELITQPESHKYDLIFTFTCN